MYGVTDQKKKQNSKTYPKWIDLQNSMLQGISQYFQLVTKLQKKGRSFSVTFYTQ